MTGEASFYTAAIQTGVNMLMDESPESRAVYNQQFAIEMKKLKGRYMEEAALTNMVRVKSNKILSNVDIQLQQAQTEAAIKLNAAVAGVEGGSVDNAIQQAGRNAAARKHASNRSFDQQLADLASEAGMSSYLQNTQDVEIPGWEERALATLTTDLLGTGSDIWNMMEYGKEQDNIDGEKLAEFDWDSVKADGSDAQWTFDGDLTI